MKPAIQTRLEEQLRVKGRTDYVVLAARLLQQRGHLDSSGNLTKEGQVRNDMGNEGRAIDRDPREDVYYDPNTNRTTRI